MKVAYLLPREQYQFFHSVIPYIDHDIVVNEIPSDANVILAGILPQTPEWYKVIISTKLPVVVWHWDLYSFVDYKEYRWQSFLDFLPKAEQIWSCSYETARQLKETLGYDSHMVPAYVDSSELKERKTEDFIFYAAGRSIGKRLDWVERACEILGRKLVISTGQKMPRQKYLETLSSCRVYTMPAFEESNGTIPAMEAMASGTAVVVADIPSSREVFGSFAYYFAVNDFKGFLVAITEAWEKGSKIGAKERMLELFEVKKVAKKMSNFLRGL